MLQDLVEFIAKAVVDDPGEVLVTEIESERALVFQIKVASSDMGRIIGKKGRVIHAIRSVVQAAATKQGKRAVIEIQE